MVYSTAFMGEKKISSVFTRQQGTDTSLCTVRNEAKNLSDPGILCSFRMKLIKIIVKKRTMVLFKF
jgi:hypothetical protein